MLASRPVLGEMAPGAAVAVGVGVGVGAMVVCRHDQAVIRAAVGDFLAALGARSSRKASSRQKPVRHCRAHAGVDMGWPVMTTFLPGAVGERVRAAVPRCRAREPDPPGDGGALAGAGADLAGTTERCQSVAHVPQSRPGRLPAASPRR